MLYTGSDILSNTRYDNCTSVHRISGTKNFIIVDDPLRNNIIMEELVMNDSVEAKVQAQEERLAEKSVLQPIVDDEQKAKDAGRATAILSVAILQKYAGIPGYEKVLDQCPEDMIETITRVLWKKGYLYGFNKHNLHTSSLGEDTLRNAMKVERSLS